MPSNHLILCRPLLLLPSVSPSIRVFSNESTLLIRGPKYWSLSISPSDKYSVLISFRIDWFDLHAIQWTLKNLLQYHSLKASVPQCSTFLWSNLTTVHDYWKNHSSDNMNLCQKVMSLLFNMLSRFVIAFLPQSRYLLISWLQSLSSVVFGAQ